MSWFGKSIEYTHTTSCLFLVLGSSISKPHVMSSHFQFACSLGRWCSNFACWQVRHLTTKSVTSFFIPGHKYDLFISWYIIVTFGWLVYLEWCASCKMSLLSSSFCVTVSHPSNLITSSFLFLTRLREVRNPCSSLSVSWATLTLLYKILEMVKIAI